MRGVSFFIAVVAICAFARPGYALYGEYDCAEFSDEELVNIEPLQPPAPKPSMKPLS